MSLLIEALKKAEDDAKKRKLASASNGQATRPVSAGRAKPPAASALPLSIAERDTARLPKAADFSELTLASTDFSAPAYSAPPTPPTRQIPPTPPLVTPTAPNDLQPDLQPLAQVPPRTARETPRETPREPAPPDVIAARSVAYSGGATNDTPAMESTLDMASRETKDTKANMSPPVTPRQAKSAASVMAGQQPPDMAQGKKRRQAVLLGLAVLITLPVAAFYLFGDALFKSTDILSTSAINTTPSTATASSAVSTPALPSTVPLAAAANPAPAVRLPPALEGRTTPARPARATDNPRRSSNATTAAAVNQAAPAVVTGAAKPASLMASAYTAYQTGKPDEAARLYREVLKNDPSQRDAWLGLAVIAHADNQREPAMDAYKRVLRLEPQNATALAGLSSLSSASDEPRQESRLRELLARSPQEADLNHALGLALSGEQRWSEAQPLFFKAHALAPQEPKFAYNLAVTLDHLRKSSLAIQYYDTALALARGQPAAFDEQSARNRVSVLKAAAAEKKSP